MNDPAEVVSGSGWWGRACCALGRAAACRHSCATASDTRALTCRRSDEVAFYECVQRQHEAQWCCSQTLSVACHEACRKAARAGGGAAGARAAAASQCEHSPQLLRCLKDLTGSPVHAADTILGKLAFSPRYNQTPGPKFSGMRSRPAYSPQQITSERLLTTFADVPCCRESSNPDCQVQCEATLRRGGDVQEIAKELEAVCGEPALHNEMWQCFLRKDAPPDPRDQLPHDAAKLHCCQKMRKISSVHLPAYTWLQLSVAVIKAATINCRRLCTETFGTGWRGHWQDFFAECYGDPQETLLTQCVEEVEEPCTLGCNGLTYCSQLNNRPTGLFRACAAHADLDAHLAVAEQGASGYVMVSGMKLPLRNSSQCSTDVWKSVACALHVKPCTAKGHSSLICSEDCQRLMSACVEWARAPPELSVRAVCARLAPADPAAPCVPLQHYMTNSPDPPLLSAREAVTSPCAGAPCNATQVCVVNRGCLYGGSCAKYTCLDGCPLGEDSPHVIPVGSWARVPMAGPPTSACYKICRCGPRGLAHCQPLPCVPLEPCRLHDATVQHGQKYYMECNACACSYGELVCSRRACGRAAQLSGLPCNCPPHHLPVSAATVPNAPPQTLYPNACLAKCAGAKDAEIEFGVSDACARTSCPRRQPCLSAPNVCLSRLQHSCPQHVCVNTTSCSSQPSRAVCDVEGRTHASSCHLALSGQRFAYWGECLRRCDSVSIFYVAISIRHEIVQHVSRAGSNLTAGRMRPAGRWLPTYVLNDALISTLQKIEVCGVNGVTYSSECAAHADFVSVDYLGPCLAVGAISDVMEPKCQIDRILCPALKKRGCAGFTAPGACCPQCGGALRILYSKKQIDRALYATNISATVMNLRNMLIALDRHVKIAECALRGYLTIEMEIFIIVESVLTDPTDLQLQVCVLEAEKLADLINRESALIGTDLSLSALTYALVVHGYPNNGV
ncbi:Reversion-inducing cysteine-rich protein with Kazal motifs, partial [Eumeta japonica]